MHMHVCRMAYGLCRMFSGLPLRSSHAWKDAALSALRHRQPVVPFHGAPNWCWRVAVEETRAWFAGAPATRYHHGLLVVCQPVGIHTCI